MGGVFVLLIILSGMVLGEPIMFAAEVAYHKLIGSGKTISEIWAEY